MMTWMAVLVAVGPVIFIHGLRNYLKIRRMIETRTYQAAAAYFAHYPRILTNEAAAEVQRQRQAMASQPWYDERVFRFVKNNISQYDHLKIRANRHAGLFIASKGETTALMATGAFLMLFFFILSAVFGNFSMYGYVWTYLMTILYLIGLGIAKLFRRQQTKAFSRNVATAVRVSQNPWNWEKDLVR